jgi:microcystin-dependent protein
MSGINSSLGPPARRSHFFKSVNVFTSESDKWRPVKPSHAGDIKYSIKNTDHDGWLICDGRNVSRSIYHELFNVIGTSFGSGDGSTTFTLPDCRGRVIGALGSGTGLTARTLGTSVGAETHTLAISEMPSHTHGITDPGHTHSYVNNTNNQSTDNAFATQTSADDSDLAATTGSSTTGITVNSAGGGNAHNNMQPTIFMAHVFIYGL